MRRIKIISGDWGLVAGCRYRTLSFVPHALCLMFVFLYGCGTINPPEDYYGQVLETEKHGEQVRRDTGRHPGEVIAPATGTAPARAETSPVVQLAPEETQQRAVEDSDVEHAEDVEQEHENPPQRTAVQESPPFEPSPEPIGVGAEVIKSALNATSLNIRVRNVELVNGRLSGGKNSVRVTFLSGSVDVIDDRFVTICAVIYHLDCEASSVDVVVGIAEDEQANLLAILQSDMSGVVAWMTNEILRAEWYSKVTRKIL